MTHRNTRKNIWINPIPIYAHNELNINYYIREPRLRLFHKNNAHAMYQVVVSHFDTKKHLKK